MLLPLLSNVLYRWIFAHYGKFVEAVFGVDPLGFTPLSTKQDSIDYILHTTREDFHDQFLNTISRSRTYFSADLYLGAAFGVTVPLDRGQSMFLGIPAFLSGMLSLHDGESLPELIGRYLRGNNFVSLIYAAAELYVILMILVGPVSAAGPARGCFS